jgi:glycosyltransferase involved in cell wall biosynthesis
VVRTLDRLTSAQRTVVIDSGSTNESLNIIRSYRQVKLFHKQFEDFASQCNFGIAQINSPWVLSLDADYELSDELVAELHDLKPDTAAGGFRARFVYRIFRRLLRARSTHHARYYIGRTARSIGTRDTVIASSSGQGHVSIRSFLVFFYTLVVKGCSLDGWPDWYCALQRLLFETMLALHLTERRFIAASKHDRV